MAEKKRHVIDCPHCGVTYDLRTSMQGRAAQIDDARGRWFVRNCLTELGHDVRRICTTLGS
jgi:hypothetical protein